MEQLQYTGNSCWKLMAEGYSVIADECENCLLKSGTGLSSTQKKQKLEVDNAEKKIK